MCHKEDKQKENRKMKKWVNENEDTVRKEHWQLEEEAKKIHKDYG